MVHLHTSAAAVSDGAILRRLADTLPSMLAYWDTSLRCRFANRAYKRWFGVEPEDIVGRHIRELLGPRLYELNLPHMQAALRGERRSFEREIPDPSGGPARHSIANYVPDVQGSAVRGFFVEVTDISEIKRAEMALRESEERFRLTLDEAPIGMALVAPDGRFLRVNRALCDIVGYEPEELTGLTFQAITHPDDIDADVALLGRVARGEIPRYTLDKRYVRKDGRVVDVVLHGSVLRDAHGTPIHFIAQIEDVTERRRAERHARILAEVSRRLAESLDLETILETVVEVGVRWLADCCVVELVSDGEDDSRRQVAPRDADHTWPCELVEPTLRAAVETRRTVVEQLRREGLSSASSVLAVPLVARGKVLGALAFVSAASDLAADAELAQPIAERAALKIANAQLYLAAQRAQKARDEVLGVVAHDLRNPLNAIVLQAALLRRNVENIGLDAKGLRTIENAARRMDRLIQDLVDVTRLEAGVLTLRPGPTSARQLVQDAVASQAPLAANAGIELRSDVAPGVDQVLAVPDRVLRVFENLIGNALKFTPRGGRVEVRAIPEGTSVLFSVRDTGRGIASEDLPHVFDRFWQEKKGEHRGAGLGLAIAKGIVEAHGGTLRVESVVSEGTTFSFALPTP